MGGVAEWLGWPQAERKRGGTHVLYLMLDVHSRNTVGGTGYPHINDVYDPYSDLRYPRGAMSISQMAAAHPSGTLEGAGQWIRYDGKGTQNYLKRGVLNGLELHELGHTQQSAFNFYVNYSIGQLPQATFNYEGEPEGLVNFVYTYVAHVKMGVEFDKAFSGAEFMGGCSPDVAPMTWMWEANFREGKMISHAEGQLAYQCRAHAKYADIVRLFGWEAWTGTCDRHRQISRHAPPCSVQLSACYSPPAALRLLLSAAAELRISGPARPAGLYYTEHKHFPQGWAVGLDLEHMSLRNDRRTLKLSIIAGYDLTPLIHFCALPRLESLEPRL